MRKYCVFYIFVSFGEKVTAKYWQVTWQIFLRIFANFSDFCLFDGEFVRSHIVLTKLRHQRGNSADGDNTEQATTNNGGA